jgi:hypothetical protein
MKHLSRRTFLRGLGVALALPHLEIMAATAKAAAKPPVRLAFLFTPNGLSMPLWTPSSEGALDTLPKLLSPFENVKDSISVLTGLAQANAFPNGDGPGDHARSAAAWLTGVHPRKTAGSDIHNGISADQVAAMKLGDRTIFPSLEIGGEHGQNAGSCDSGYSCAYSSTISWRSPTLPVPKESDPRQVFGRLFGTGNVADPSVSIEKRFTIRTSILDYVLAEAQSLRNDLGIRDRQKLDEYMSGVREIEIRLQKIEKAGKLIEVGKEPEGIPTDFGEQLRLMGDMMILAFQADLTRVSTFMMANEGSNRAYHEIGVSDGHHEVSHHGKDSEKIRKKAEIDLFHLKQVAYIVERMSKIQELGSSMLDNTLLVFGTGIGDGDRHNHDDLPILLAGKGGGSVKTGQHFIFPKKTPLNNLYLSMLDRFGVEVDQLGDSTGKLSMLF